MFVTLALLSLRETRLRTSVPRVNAEVSIHRMATRNRLPRRHYDVVAERNVKPPASRTANTRTFPAKGARQKLK
jgi:hypothetical protein